MPELAPAAKGFAAICESPLDRVPTVADFVALRNIPQGKPTPQVSATPARPTYLAAFPVLSAASYSTCLARVGDVVELLGQVTQVHHGTTNRPRRTEGRPTSSSTSVIGRGKSSSSRSGQRAWRHWLSILTRAGRASGLARKVSWSPRTSAPGSGTPTWPSTSPSPARCT